MRTIGQGSVTNREDDQPSLVSLGRSARGERLLDEYAERGIQTLAVPNWAATNLMFNCSDDRKPPQSHVQAQRDTTVRALRM
jgi:hypothetical protein